jgi:mRNA interferase HicA
VKQLDLVRHLLANGCRLLREGANHSIFIKDQTGRRASVPRHREIKFPTAVRICKQLDVPAPPTK